MIYMQAQYSATEPRVHPLLEVKWWLYLPMSLTHL